MLTRRLQLLIDEDRYARLEREAEQRGVSIAQLVREAVDAAFPSTSAERAAAGQRILDAEPMAVPEVDELKGELAELRGRAR